MSARKPVLTASRASRLSRPAGSTDDGAPSSRTALRPRSATVASALVALAVATIGWQLLVLSSDGWVPSLGAIGESFFNVVVDPATYRSFLITGGRMLVGFTAVMGISLALGITVGTVPVLDHLTRPLLVLGLATPDPVYFIMALMILGTDAWVPMLALVVGLVPYATGIFRGAVLDRDRNAQEMARVYQLNRRQVLRHVLVPQIVPATLAAGRSTFALTWKVVVLMEVLTKPDGVGADIYLAYRLLDPAEMLVLAALFIVLMRVFETVMFAPIERAGRAWRQ